MITRIHRTAICFLLAFILIPFALIAEDGVPLLVEGITAPVYDGTLSSTVAGKIEVLHVEEGDKVGEDEPLLSLESRVEQLEVQRRKLIWENQALLESAKAQVDTIREELQSTRSLFESTGSVSQEELDRKKLELVLAASELKGVQSDKQQQEAEYRMAQEQLERRTLRAPSAGTVTRVFLEPGETCEPRQPLVHLVDASRCFFRASVLPEEAKAIQKATRLNLLWKDLEKGELRRSAKLLFVSPVADAASGLQAVKLEVENQDGAITPGTAALLEVDASSSGTEP